LPEDERARLARALGRTRDLFVLHPLWKLCRDRSVKVRLAAIEGLGLLRRGEALSMLFGLTYNGQVAVARAAVLALGRYPLPEVRRYLNNLAGNASIAEPLRLGAVKALQQHGTPEARAALAAIATGAGAAAAAAARTFGVASCATCREPLATLLLRTLLSEGKPDLRASAVRKLVEHADRDSTGEGKKGLLPALLFAADDGAPQVRRAALTALAHHADPRAERRLIEALERSATFDEQKLALSVLRERRGKAVRRALMHAVLDGDIRVRPPALDALEQHEDREVDAFLLQVFDRTELRDVRLRAARVLARRKAAGIAERLWAGSQDQEHDVARFYLRLLRDHFPAEYARRKGGKRTTALEARRAPLPQPIKADRAVPGVDRRGFIPLLASAGAAGGGGLYAIAAGAQGKHAWVGGLSGAVLGGGTAALLNLKGEVTLGDAGSFLTVAGWSVAAGLQSGLAAGLERELAWTVLGSDVLGVGGAVLAMKQRWSGRDLAFINLTAAEGSIAGLGLGAILFPHGSGTVGERVGHGLAGGLLPAAALTAASLSTRRVHLGTRDVGLVTYGGVVGGTIGGLLVPGISRDPPAERVGGAVALGEALGYGSAVLVAQYSDLSAPEQGWMWASTTGLTLAGGGLGMLVPGLRGRPSFALASGGAGLGVALGALGHRPLSLRAKDLPLASLGAGVGAWTGAWLPVLIHDSWAEADSTGAAGGALLLGMSGMLAGDVVSRLTDVSGRTVGISAITTVAATAAGGGTGMMLGQSPRALGVGLMHGLTAAGLATGVILAPRMRFSRGDVSLTGVSAAYAAASLGMVPALRHADDEGVPAREVAGGLIAGVGLGTLAGMAAAQWSNLDRGDVGEVGVWSMGGFSLGAGLGLLIDHGRRATVGVAEGVGAAGLATGGLLARRMRYSRRDALLMTQLSLGAAFQGVLLPDVWREEGLDLPRGVRVGGVMAGSSLGLLAGALIAQRTEIEPGDVGEMTLSLAAGDLLGAGIGLLGDLSHSNTMRLMQGVGISTWLAGSLRAPHTTHTRRDALLIAQLGAGGVLQGAFLPDLWHDDGFDSGGGSLRAGGAMALGSTGLIIGSLIAQRTEVAPGDVGEMSLALAAGDLLGAGIGLLADLSPTNTVRLMQGVGTATWVAGSLRAPYTVHTRRDAVLMTQLAAGGALQGAFLPDLWHEEDFERGGRLRAGGAMALGSTGLILGSLIAQRTEVEPGDVGEMSLALAAGDALGAGIGLLADLGRSNTVRLMQGVGISTWVAGSLRAPRTRHSSRDALLMTQLGAGGVLQGAFLPDLWREEGADLAGSVRAGGAMALGSAGLILGSLLAQRSEVAPGDVGEMSLALAAGDAMGAGIGLLADLSHSNTIRLMEGVGLAAWVAGGLRAPRTHHSGRDALLMAQLAAGGVAQGAMLPDLWRSGDEGPTGAARAGGAMALGSAALVTGSLLAQRSEVEPGDVGEMALALAAGDALGAGIGLAAELGEANTLRVMQGVGTAVWIAGSLRAPATRYTGRDRRFMAMLSGYGAFLGAWTPVWESGDLQQIKATQVVGGVLAGSAAGLIAGSLVTPQIDLGATAVGEVGLASAGWSLFGAGLGLMIPVQDDRLPIILMQGVGLAGTVGSSFLVDRTRYSTPDRVLTTLTVAFGTWQGVGTSLLLDASDRQIAGATMATTGLGFMAGATISQFIDLTQAEVWTLFSGSVWGAMLGVVGANIARDAGSDLSTGEHVGITTLASDVGLGLGILALSPMLRWSAKRVGYINLFGLGGVALGAAIGGPIESRIGTQIGVMAGSVAGLTTGIILTGWLGLGEPKPEGASAPTDPAGRPAAGGEFGSTSPTKSRLPDTRGRITPLIADWMPTVMMEPDVDLETGETRRGSVKMLFGVRGLLH